MNNIAYVSLASVSRPALCGRRFLFDEADPIGPVEKLRQEFARLQDEGKAVVATAIAEDRELTAEEKTANDQRFTRITSIKSRLDDHLKFANLALDNGTVTRPRDPDGREEFERADGVTDLAKVDRQEFGRALGRWAHTGVMDKRFTTITTGTSSSAYLPRTIAQPVLATLGNQLRVGMALVGATPVSTDSTADMNLPVVSAAIGTDLTESGTSGVENGTDGSAMLAPVSLKCYVAQSGFAWVSNLELGALDYDFLTAMQPALYDAMDTRVEQKTMAAIIADAGITQSVAAASTSALGLDNLIDLNRKLGTRFDRQKVIYLSNAAYAAAEKLVGEDGHPILNRDPQNQSLVRFNGTPVLKSDYLEAFGASKVIGIVVSFVGARLRDAGTDKLIRVDNDKDRVDQTGINCIGYRSFGYVAAAIATLKTPAS